MPVLSETLNRARLIGLGVCIVVLSSLRKFRVEQKRAPFGALKVGLSPLILVHAVLLQLFAQCATVDAHHDGGASLVTASVGHYFFQ